MYLKKLEIQGFKSFADKTSVDFNQGITSVVGPNGSGKSNISDAIRWVLGEQSAKSLRGGKMEDVIFAGTEHRKALGFAQVSLTIQNDSKLLPVDFSEVTISRRVYRSGEGEYFINKVPCRLKDIHELFMDTGIGKDGYSVIGQGRIDEILSTKSEDRRAIFEEASGIMKYKIRKLDAERKLDSTQTNLERINDIVAEIENALETIKEQAETAKKYLSLKENLKKLEVSVFLEKISKLKGEKEDIKSSINLVEENLNEENEKLNQENQKNKESLDLIKNLEDTLEKITKEYYECEKNIEKNISSTNLNKEKVVTLEKNIERLNGEISNLKTKECEISLEIKEKNEKLQEFSMRKGKDTEKLSEVQTKYDKLVEDLDDGQKKLDSLNANYMQKINLQSNINLKISENKNILNNLNVRGDNVKNEMTLMELEKKDLEDRIKEKETDLDNLIKEIRDKKNSLQSLENEHLQLLETLSNLEKKYNEAQNEIHLKSSRKKMLENMDANMEGYYRSIKEILKECGRNNDFSQGIHGPLFKLVDVSGINATAIELALGGALQNIVTSTENDAKKAIEYLKKGKFGRCTFLPITSIKGKKLDQNTLNQVQSMDGFVGLASDLLTFDKTYENIILNLLGRVVVVENLDYGINMAKKTNNKFKIVTRDGDIINTTGSMSGGSNDSKETGVLSRTAQINEIAREIETSNLKKSNLLNDLENVKTMLKEVNEEKINQERVLRDTEHSNIKEESLYIQYKDNLSNVNKKLDSLEEERDNFEVVLKEAKEGVYSSEKELEDLNKELEELKAYISKNQQDYKNEQQGREKILSEITDLKVSISALNEAIENYGNLLRRLLSENDELKQTLIQKEDEIKRDNQQIERIHKENLEINQSLELLNKKKVEKDLLIKEKNNTKLEIEKRTSKIIESLENTNQSVRLLNEEQGRLEIKKARVESELELVQNRLWDEYELTYNNAIPIKEPIENLLQAQKDINSYRSQIKELGHINVAAIDEYIKLKERYDFLKTQKDDLENSKKKLKGLINEMLTIMKDQFLEKFKLINDNFSFVFKELFNGGQAKLTLTDEENVLESGIDIQVQPPGKKLQNMMLLSGGERAFTAIALLFAILKLRPAPFCLLDEIEAALDDANVYRFAEYIRSHTHLTQFLVITHRKGTMEFSDALYGVTMQEKGISNIYSMKLEHSK